MIVARIIPGAGMGNQMFMYAAGLASASRLNTELRLGTWDFERATRADRPYQLRFFPAITEPEASFTETFRINPKTAVMNLITRTPIRRLHLFRRAIRKILNKLARFDRNVYQPKYFSWSPEFQEKIKDNMIITGYWESEKNFVEVADLVRKKFQFAPECFSPELSAKVRGCNSVAVHVRRGDKVKPNGLLMATRSDYIRSALAKISALTENPKFFVFSDDIDWCRHNLHKINDAHYSFIEGQTPAQDMALMTLCRNVIVSVSTFSWWVAWLNDNPNKIVIAPNINLWYESGVYDPEDRKHLLPESWLKIG